MDRWSHTNSRASMASCEDCERLRSAVLKVTMVYHNLLAVLEAVHNDPDLTPGIQQHIAKTVKDRDEAIRNLKDHEHTHTKRAARWIM